MCGIAGVVSRNRSQIEPAVRAMMHAMVHRGPDDEGFRQVPLGSGELAPAAGFGFRRLAILDLSPAGHQPMVNQATGDCLIFNGEIYNFRHLRERLKARDIRFHSTGDTEVLLHALSNWGEAAIDELDGMFAFAFYHAATGRILLARDHLGIKPLYVARTGDTVAFASEVRAILASGLVPDDLDPAGIAGFLAYGAPQDPLTIHRHIRSLPAGGCEWIDRESLADPVGRPRRWWSFPDRVGKAPPAPRAADRVDCAEPAAVGRIRDELTSSVLGQCIADVPVGVFLSGGIDSAAIAGFARRETGQVCTFSVGFESSGGQDELEDARATAQSLGTRHFQTVMDDDWVQGQWQQWMKAGDRPSIDGLNTYIVSGAVSDADTKVALSGLGADELFGGYGHFQSIPALRRLLQPIGWVPRGIRRSLARAATSILSPARRQRAMALASSGTSPLDLLLLVRRLTVDDDLRGLGFDARALGLRPDFLCDAAIERLRPTGGDQFRAISQAECVLYMGNTLLRDVDVNSMAHSLEVRVPFLGRRLVDYVCGLSGAVQSPPGSLPKHLLRHVVAEKLPAAILVRPKKGFSLPIGEWMRTTLRGPCEAAIDEVAGSSLFPTGATRNLYRRYLEQGDRVHWTRPLALVALGSYLSELKRRRPARPAFGS